MIKIESKDFLLDLIKAIPSNLLVAKVTGYHPATISLIRKKNGLPSGRKLSMSKKNLKKFMPELISICQKHNQACNIEMLNSIEKVNKANIKKVKLNISDFNTDMKAIFKKNRYSENELEKIKALSVFSTSVRNKMFADLGKSLGRTACSIQKKYSNLKLNGQINDTTILNNKTAPAVPAANLDIIPQMKIKSSMYENGKTPLHFTVKIEGIELNLMEGDELIKMDGNWYKKMK